MPYQRYSAYCIAMARMTFPLSDLLNLCPTPYKSAPSEYSAIADYFFQALKNSPKLDVSANRIGINRSIGVILRKAQMYFVRGSHATWEIVPDKERVVAKTLACAYLKWSSSKPFSPAAVMNDAELLSFFIGGNKYGLPYVRYNKRGYPYVIHSDCFGYPYVIHNDYLPPYINNIECYWYEFPPFVSKIQVPPDWDK